MGDRTGPIYVMAWQRTLGEMMAHGSLLAQSCGACKKWTRLNVADLAALMGEDASLWDRQPACPSCGQPSRIMASAGEGTPFRALSTPAGRRALGAPDPSPKARDFTATELLAFTPEDVAKANIDLSIFCAACRVLRPISLDRLVAGRGVQPVSAMKFRCGKCRGPGSALLSWRDHNNEYRSFDFANL